MTCVSAFQRAGLLGLAIALAAPATSRADVKLPSIFGSHMVLQQGQKDRVWGKASPGEKVTVSIADQSKSAEADKDGKWMVTLDPLSAGGPLTMTVEGKNKVTFDDVLVGEVWLCSGQSNMEMDVKGSNDGDLESMTAKYPKIRLISVPKLGTQEPKDDFKGQWEVCTPKTVRDFSAVGFFFGRQLYEDPGRAHRIDRRLVGRLGVRGVGAPRPALGQRGDQAAGRDVGEARGRPAPGHGRS